MADRISPQEIRRRLILFLRIPNETWTDVFKLFSRRVLVKQFSPACYRLKEICNKNVKCVHMIVKAGQFARRLDWDSPWAMKDLGHLAGNGCHLAEQFRLIEVSISSERSQDILRHCPDLFDGCQIKMDVRKSSPLFLQTLDQLEKAKPVEISVDQSVDEDEAVDFWHNPTFQNCPRIVLRLGPFLSDATMDTAFVNIFDWLHLQPSGMEDCDDDDGSSADHDQQQQQQQVRCVIMILWLSDRAQIDGLLARCSENIQQSRGPADRRQYVLSIGDPECTGFGQFRQFRRIENKSTGEVLTFEQKVDAKGNPTDSFRLRRCMAEEEANGAEFYAGMFESDDRGRGYDKFKIDDRKKAAKVTIG